MVAVGVISRALRCSCRYKVFGPPIKKLEVGQLNLCMLEISAGDESRLTRAAETDLVQSELLESDQSASQRSG